ncbi:Patatin-like phospholipase domain-containing protein, partial [Schistosoma japonicum]
MEASALEPTTVLCLPTQSFLEICKPQTPALFRIIQMIAVRLQRLSFNALHTYLGLALTDKQDLDFISPEVKFAKIELDQVLTSNDHSNLDSTFQSGALELGEAPALYSRKKKLPSILSPSQPPSPNCKHHFTNLRRALSLADTSPNLNAKYNYVDGIRDDNRLNDKEEHYDLTNELNFTKDELKEVIKLAEKDLANLLNLTDSSILHGMFHWFLFQQILFFQENQKCNWRCIINIWTVKGFQSSGEPDNEKGDIANHVYVVLSGRLRQVDSMPDGSHRIVSELGRGDLVGFLEVFSQQTRISTVWLLVPQVLTRIIQLLSDKLLGNLTTGSSVASPLVTGGLGYTSGGNSNMDVLYSPLNSGVMTNLRTIAVLPSTTDINAEAFTLELQHSMSPMGYLFVLLQ